LGAARGMRGRRGGRLAAAHRSRRWRGLGCEVGDEGGVGEVERSFSEVGAIRLILDGSVRFDCSLKC
jgi:hypothetical protein